MEDERRDVIRRNITSLVNQTDLEIMRSALYERGIFTEHNMETYTDTNNTQMHRKRCMYNDIMRRGPRAFDTLLEALEENGYWDIVRMLDPNSILNSYGGASSRLHNIERENEFVSISERKKSKRELYSRNVGNGSAANKREPVALIVKKSTKFVEDNESNDIRLYPTRGKRRGVLLVFSYISFHNKLEEERTGAEVDSANLDRLFKKFGFDTFVYLNFTLEKTQSKLEEMRDVFKSKPDCVFVVVSSHGYERLGTHDTDIRCSDGKLISLQTIVSYFNNSRLPQLRDVPKVFVFQNCRGVREDYVDLNEYAPPGRPLWMPAAAETDGTVVPPDARAPPHELEPKKMPTCTDVLVVHSTLPGYVSRRDPALGSWYIQVMCETFAERAHDCHVVKLFTMVDKRLKERFQIQTSSVDSWGFNRRLYLHPGLVEES